MRLVTLNIFCRALEQLQRKGADGAAASAAGKAGHSVALGARPRPARAAAAARSTPPRFAHSPPPCSRRPFAQVPTGAAAPMRTLHEPAAAGSQVGRSRMRSCRSSRARPCLPTPVCVSACLCDASGARGPRGPAEGCLSSWHALNEWVCRAYRVAESATRVISK